MSEDIHLRMVENGLDYIVKALETIENKDGDLKYTILNLHAGIQLLLKELLFQEHWSLIFKDVNKSGKKLLETGDFESVNHEGLFIRLKKIAGLTIDENFEKKIDWLRKERNKAEHYQFRVNSITLKSQLVDVLTLLIPLIRSEFIPKGYIDVDDEKIIEINGFVHRFEDYVRHRLELIKEDLNRIDIVLECPDCFNLTVDYIESDEAFCYFCGGFIDDFTSKYIDYYIDPLSHILDGGESPLIECPECGVDQLYSPIHGKFLCLNCGIKLDQSQVIECPGPRCDGKLIYKSDNLCEICQEYINSQ